MASFHTVCIHYSKEIILCVSLNLYNVQKIAAKINYLYVTKLTTNWQICNEHIYIIIIKQNVEEDGTYYADWSFVVSHVETQ